MGSGPYRVITSRRCSDLTKHQTNETFGSPTGIHAGTDPGMIEFELIIPPMSRKCGTNRRRSASAPDVIDKEGYFLKRVVKK